MGFELNGGRLREARRYRQISITGLADKIGVTKQMVSKYERGNALPGIDVFQRIIQELNFPLEYFVEKDKFNFTDEGTFFRSRLTAIQAEKTPSEMYKKAAGIVRDFFGKYIEFPDLFTVDSKKMRVPRKSAVELRNLWGLGDRPISDMVRLLESHGIIVSVLNSGSSKIDAHSGYVNINGNRYYLVHVDGNSHSFYRQQFGLAHELGHYILHANSIELSELEPDEYRQMEKEADEFASEFLLPSEAFKNSLKDDITNLDWYLRLKGTWFVSVSAMVYRARVLQLINADDYLKLQKRISYRKWRKEEPFDKTKELSMPKLLSQSIELLEGADIIKPSMLSSKLNDEYGISFPNEILAEVIGIPIQKFSSDIVQLRR